MAETIKTEHGPIPAGGLAPIALDEAKLAEVQKYIEEEEGATHHLGGRLGLALTLLAAFAGIVPAVGDATPRSAAAIAAQALAARVPEMPLTLADGRRTSLAELGREGPLLLTFFYRRCPLVCRPYLRELRSALERRRSSGPAPRVVAVSFDPEEENPADMQRGGWQAILDSFARYLEAG